MFILVQFARLVSNLENIHGHEIFSSYTVEMLPEINYYFSLFEVKALVKSTLKLN